MSDVPNWISRREALNWQSAQEHPVVCFPIFAPSQQPTQRVQEGDPVARIPGGEFLKGAPVHALGLVPWLQRFKWTHVGAQSLAEALEGLQPAVYAALLLAYGKPVQWRHQNHFPASYSTPTRRSHRGQRNHGRVPPK
jgi:hypothetical protein